VLLRRPCFQEEIDSTRIDLNHEVPKDVIKGLGELGLFGVQIPTNNGGLGLSNTSYARIMEEVVHDASVAVTLMAHQSIGLKGIIMFGTDAQKSKVTVTHLSL
jgi:acyl-CoA dehydrogenase family member 9